jgi:hypothetical protein
MRGALRKVTLVTPREWLDLLRAQWALIKAQVSLKTTATGGLVTLGTPELGAPPEGALRRRAGQLSWAVTRAARYGVFRPKCLACSLALHRLLVRAGIGASRIHIGVRSQGTEFRAHAWVTVGGLVLGDDPAFVATFSEIADARVAGLL